MSTIFVISVVTFFFRRVSVFTSSDKCGTLYLLLLSFIRKVRVEPLQAMGDVERHVCYCIKCRKVRVDGASTIKLSDMWSGTFAVVFFLFRKMRVGPLQAL